MSNTSMNTEYGLHRDGSGNLQNLRSYLNGIAPADTLVFGTVAEMTSATIAEGALVQTKGYYTAGDGGDALYLVKTGIADNIVDHDVSGGLVAELQFDEYPTFEQCGGQLFDSRTDPGFTTSDASSIINGVIANTRIEGLVSGRKGYANVPSQIIIDRSFTIDFGGLTWQGFSDGFFELVGQTSIGNLTGVILVKSGVRQVNLRNFKVKCYTNNNGLFGVQLGDLLYEDDIQNINSGIHLENIVAERFNSCFRYNQIFLSTFKNCSAVQPTIAGFYCREGGTSVLWENCSTLGGQYGFYWWTGTERTGHIYSTMINCVPQSTTLAAYLFRNTTVSMVGCGQEFCTGAIIYCYGAGSVSIDSFSNLNENDAKPTSIFYATADSNGRFGYAISCQTLTVAVSNFSGTPIQFMRTPSATPSSILSSTRWDFPETCFRSDGTAALDRDTWRSGYYYEHFVPLEEQLSSIERYARNGQTQAFITLDNWTDHTITGKLDTSLGNAFFKMKVTTGGKTFKANAQVDAVATANSDTTDRGIIFSVDNSLGQKLNTGNLYLEAWDKSSEEIYVETNASGLLTISFDGDTLVGDILIERKKLDFEFPL